MTQYPHGGQPQYPAPYPGQPQVVMVQGPPKGLSITGLILGIASVVGFSWSGLVPIAGIIISAIALNKEPAGRTMATWGLILSILSILLVVVAILILAFSGIALLAPLLALIGLSGATSESSY